LLLRLLNDKDAWEMVSFDHVEEAPISFMRPAQASAA
jgi:UDP-3-O-[3-hydroxymyristoyl] N-acetylglucosamine deacetylase